MTIYNKWTKFQIETLTAKYETESTHELSKLIGKKECDVRTMAHRLKLRKVGYVDWSTSDVNKLQSHYPASTRSDIISMFYPRKWENIKKKASVLGIKRNSKGMDSIKGNLSVLLDDNKTAAYWLGFLLADGHFSKTNRIKLTLATKDSTHVEKFAEFIKYTGDIKKYEKSSEVSVMDSYVVKNIKIKFDICSTKTYNPPKLEVFEKMDDDYFISALIGFIDGDGSIQNRKNGKFGYINIKCHSAWLENLNYFMRRLNALTELDMPLGKLNNRGYARIFITNSVAARFLKQESIKHGLPVLNRKWKKLAVLVK